MRNKLGTLIFHEIWWKQYFISPQKILEPGIYLDVVRKKPSNFFSLENTNLL